MKIKKEKYKIDIENNNKLYYTKVINRIISLFLWDTIEKEEIYEILDHNQISYMTYDKWNFKL